MLRNRDQKYQQKISRDHRTAFVLLLNFSATTTDVMEYEGRMTTKCECVGQIAEQILRELYAKTLCNGESCNCYDVAVISYSGRGVLSHLGGGEWPFMPINEITDGRSEISVLGLNPLYNPEEVSDLVLDGSIVVEPIGESPAYESLLWIYEFMEEWCLDADNQDSYPPMIIHVTDGNSTDASLEEIADISQNIMSLGTNDGDILLFNIYLSDVAQGEALLFPTDDELSAHPSDSLRGLGQASSLMPKRFNDIVESLRPRSATQQRYRCIGYNSSSIVGALSMISVGTDVE